jgi:glucan biosynthesis protein
MLSKKETVIMREIYKRTTNNNGKCLVRPVDLMAAIPYSVELTADELPSILQNLAYDEYFELVETEKKDEYYFCITLLHKGFAFQRAEEQRIRNRKNSILAKVGLTLLGVLLAWLLRLVIGLFFK